MEFFVKFGIDWKLLLAQAVNFLIVLLVLWKFAYKPILKLLHDREEKIDKSLSNADRVEKLKVEMEQEKTVVLAQAKKEAQVILADAQEKIELNRQTQIDKTKDEVQKLVTRAKEDIKAEKAKVMKQTESELGNIAVMIAEKLVRRELSSKDHEDLVKETLKHITV